MHIFESCGGTAEINLRVRKGRHLQPLLRGGPLRLDPRDPLRGHRIALVGDEEARRFTVRRQEHSQARLEIGVIERLRRQVEHVVVLRRIEALPHDDRRVAHGLHLVDHRREGGVHRQRQAMGGLERVDHHRKQRQHLVRGRGGAGDVIGEGVELPGELVEPVQRVE